MTYEEFVTRPLAIWRELLHKSDEVARLEGLCMRATTTLGERVQNTVGNSQERNLVALADARRELNGLISTLMAVQDEVRVFLYNNLPLDGADILEWKYVNGKSIKDIAETLGFEEQTVRNKISKYDREARKKYIEYKKV